MFQTRPANPVFCLLGTTKSIQTNGAQWGANWSRVASVKMRFQFRIYGLVGGLEHVLFSHILGIIIPIDFHIFQRGSNHQPVVEHPKTDGCWGVEHGGSVCPPCIVCKWLHDFNPAAARQGGASYHAGPEGRRLYMTSLQPMQPPIVSKGVQVCILHG